MDILNNYKQIEENSDTLFNIYIYDKKVSEIIEFVQGQINKAQKITNPLKKNKINNRLYILLKYINDLYNENSIINSIFLICDKIIEYKLNNNEIKTAKEYNFVNIFLKTDAIFYVEYFIDLFHNFDFIYSIKINKNDVQIGKLNKNKEKELEKIKVNNESQLTEAIDKIRNIYNYSNYIVIHGNSNLIINFEKKNIIVRNELLNKDSIYNLYENEIIKKNNQELEKRLNDIKNEKTNLDLYIFGKLKVEIKEAIESYSIKELYIEEKKLEKLKTFIDNTLLNFKIITIKSLEGGDIADSFIKDYNGIMGIKYY